MQCSVLFYAPYRGAESINKSKFYFEPDILYSQRKYDYTKGVDLTEIHQPNSVYDSEINSNYSNCNVMPPVNRIDLHVHTIIAVYKHHNIGY